MKERVGVSRTPSCATCKDIKPNCTLSALEEASGSQGREWEQGCCRGAPGALQVRTLKNKAHLNV